MVVGKFNLVRSIGANPVIIQPPAVLVHLNNSAFHHACLNTDFSFNSNSAASLCVCCKTDDGDDNECK